MMSSNNLMDKKTNTKNTVSISECKSYVKRLLEEQLPDHIYFHDWSHTKKIAKEAKILAKEMKLAKEIREEIIIAALFHDVGYISTHKGHENISIQMAQDYLRERNYPENKIQNITHLIEVTKENAVAKTQVEKLMKDAIFSYIGNKKYADNLRDMMAERLQTEKGKFLEMEWNQNHLDWLNAHQFQTKAARKLYGSRKEKNVLILRKRIKKHEQENSISKNKAAQIIFKTALRNHIDLTSIADQKSNIMLSINAVILTLGMPLFATYFVGRPELMIPGIIFLSTCAITMILATLATRPVSTDGETDLNKLFSGKSNLFFFGNFYNLKLSEYQDAIADIMSDRKTLEISIVNDLYYLGLALGHKFKMLRICYTVFAGGLITSFVAFAVAYIISVL